jgi:peptidoglycan/xylan/chitin deacetylase (PgdA/CDA1 family)
MKLTSSLSLLLVASIGLTACGKDRNGVPTELSGAEDRAKQMEFERDLEKFEKERLEKEKKDAEKIVDPVEKKKVVEKIRTTEKDIACRYASSIGAKPPYKRVALTFDDGPTSNGTQHVLDVLRKYGIPGTFFMQGGMAKVGPDMVAKVASRRDENVLIGNHSWNHPNFHELSFANQKSQIDRTRALLGKYQTQKFFRYPFGNSTCEGNDYIHSVGYKIVGWHIDTCDWGFDKTGTVSAKVGNICGVRERNRSNFVRHVVESTMARKGGIILMHDTHWNTVKQLEEIIDQLIKEGYSFGSLDDDEWAPSMK